MTEPLVKPKKKNPVERTRLATRPPAARRDRKSVV